MEQTCVNDYVFPALSLDVYVPHTGLVFHVVYQQNCTQGCTGHIIIKLKYYSYHYSYQARGRGGSKGSNEPPLKFDNGGLKYK